MYATTSHGLTAYTTHYAYSSGHDDTHMRQQSSPVYSYSPQPRPYMPYTASQYSDASNHSPQRLPIHPQHPHHHLSDLEDSLSGRYDYGAFTIVPTVPTPEELTRYEYGRTPSGQVLVTSGNQTVELFSGVANTPQSFTE